MYFESMNFDEFFTHRVFLGEGWWHVHFVQADPLNEHAQITNHLYGMLDAR